MVPGDVVRDQPEERRQRLGLAAGPWPRQLRDRLDLAAQAAAGHGRPGRDRLTGRSRSTKPMWAARKKASEDGRVETKAIVAVAAEKRGRGIGRIRLRRVKDVSAESLRPFVQVPWSPVREIHTDGWRGYAGLRPPAISIRSRSSSGAEPAHEVMPRIHIVAALLKRWLFGTLQAASSTNISTTTSTNSRSASTAGAHKLGDCSFIASPNRRLPSRPISHDRWSPPRRTWGEGDTH